MTKTCDGIPAALAQTWGGSHGPRVACGIDDVRICNPYTFLDLTYDNEPKVP